MYRGEPPTEFFNTTWTPGYHINQQVFSRAIHTTCMQLKDRHLLVLRLPLSIFFAPAVSGKHVVTAVPAEDPAASGLAQLKELFEIGELTNAEYSSAKIRLLQSTPGAGNASTIPVVGQLISETFHRPKKVAQAQQENSADEGLAILKDLFESGALTAAEYSSAKAHACRGGNINPLLQHHAETGNASTSAATGERPESPPIQSVDVKVEGDFSNTNGAGLSGDNAEAVNSSCDTTAIAEATIKVFLATLESGYDQVLLFLH